MSITLEAARVQEPSDSG